MIPLRLVAKALLPLGFFAYACLANLHMARVAEMPALSPSAAMTGAVARHVDDLYREEIPFKGVAVEVLGAARYALLGDGRPGVAVGADGWLFTDEELRELAAPAVPLDVTLAGIVEIRDRLEALGAALTLVPLPAKIDVLRTRAGAPGVGGGREADYARFLGALRAAGIDAVDTRPAFVARGADAFFRTDTHWTHAMVRDVAGRVAASGHLRLGAERFVIETQPRETFVGDLVTFVTSDTLAPVLGLGLESVTPIVAIPQADAAGALDLFGDETGPDTVLVGTSYSADPRWSFVERLKLALSRDVANLSREGQGPVTPMLDVLADVEAGRMDPPRQVIWEFPVRYLSDPGLWDAVGTDGGRRT